MHLGYSSEIMGIFLKFGCFEIDFTLHKNKFELSFGF
jgi:hypothetical protein